MMKKSSHLQLPRLLSVKYVVVTKYDNEDNSDDDDGNDDDDDDDDDDVEAGSYHGRVNDCSKWPPASSYPNPASCFRSSS